MFQLYVAPLLVGATLGALFATMRLPLPAPQNLGGVLGVAGVWLGYLLSSRLWLHP